MARTPSAVLPARILDAHMHVWDLRLGKHPWLCGPPIPFRYGDYGAIRRSFDLADYRAATAGLPIVGTVYVEAEWDPRDPLGETRWVHETAARDGLVAAMVAQAWLDRDDVAQVLAAQAAFPLVRGIRHKPRAARSPDHVEPFVPGSLSCPRFAKGFALLARHRLSFDLQVPWWHFGEAAQLFERHPEVPVIVNHTGLPADRSREGLEAWKAALRRLARLPQVAVKISGLGRPGRPWTAEGNRRVVEATIELFGVERCLFASNWPVDTLAGGDPRTIFAGFARITAGLSPVERDALFFANACRLYRIEPAGLAGGRGAARDAPGPGPAAAQPL